MLTFESFELEKHHRCKYDSLEVFGGLCPSCTSLTGKICGGDLPRPISAHGNVLHVQFHTDSSVNKRGFKIFYSYRLEGVKYSYSMGNLYILQ